MKRKIVKQAGKAYTITLPISWVRERGLDAGDEIELIAQERNLLLETKQTTTQSKRTLSTKGLPLATKYSFIAATYARGIDELTVKTDDSTFPNINEYLGYVVIGQSNNIFTIQDINTSINEDLDLIFKRTFQIILKYFTQASNDICGKQESNYTKIRNIDSEINKLSFFLQRAVMKKNISSSAQGKIYFAYSYALEKIGDEILRLWRLMTEEKVVVDDNLKEIFSLVEKTLNKSFSLYYCFDIKLLKELRVLKEQFRTKAFSSFSKNRSYSLMLLYLTKIFDDSYDLTHLSLMHHFEPEY
ncbi:MAG: AbrB/MazE/SpoVT family DNA-binding domain-containing protein [Nanobdellota archaeon]